MIESSEPALLIRAQSLHDEIVTVLRQSIVKGDLRPGQRLLEAELAERFGVSRAPLREALTQLIGDGLLVSLPRKGTYVVELTEQDISEIYSLRMALEGVAVGILVGKITPEQLAELRTIVGEMEAANNRNDLWMAVALDVKLHETICRMSGHRRLFQAWARITDQLRAFLAAAERHLSNRHELIDRHNDLIDAIASGNRAEAAAVLEEHMTYSTNLVLSSEFGSRTTQEES
jgi:DNA-binding GntR family transcriptional regulator